MKFRLLVIVFCFAQVSFAQLVNTVNLSAKAPYSYSLKKQLNSTKAVEQFMSSIAPSGSQMILESEQTSLTGNHYHYLQFFLGIEVHNGRIDIHTTQKGDIILIQDQLKVLPSPTDVSLPLTINPNQTWVNIDGDWEIAEWKVTNKAMGISTLFLNTLAIDQNSSKLFYQVPDSLVSAKVFLVNPLQSAQKTYGGLYVDSSDSDVPVINAEQKWVKMRAAFVNDTFWLQSKRYFFGEVSDPKTPLTYSLNDTFAFPRSHHSFEDVNAFYHVTNYSNYIESLGYEQLLPDTLLIDAHGYNGAEASSFNFGVSPLELEFGEGGVDDAEDGEVVIHEFAHSLSYGASPNTVKGWDRQAMEEGNCDYFSTSYSRSISLFGWKTIFDWDGHNPFWDGIFTGVKKKYPQDLTNNINIDREMWSSPLMCLYEKMGRTKADQLVLEHLFYQTSNTTMPQMAKVLIKIDSLVWNGEYYYDIKDCFVQFGMMAWGVGTDDINPASPIKVLNTAGFSLGVESAKISSEKSGIICAELFDISGKRIQSWKSENIIDISPTNLNSGIYILKVYQDEINLTLKLAKN